MLSTAQLIMHYKMHLQKRQMYLCVGHTSFTRAPYANDRHEPLEQQYANFHEPPILWAHQKNHLLLTQISN